MTPPSELFRAFAGRGALKLDPTCVSCTPPEHDPDTIAFTDAWKIVLHPQQCGLGNVLLATRRHVPRMADLTSFEWREFTQVISILEPALEDAFGARLVNLAYQRNWAYRETDPDPPLLTGRPNPHVHWHVTPRYDQAVTFEGVTFEDPTFGEPYEWREKHVPEEQRVAIIERLRARLNVSVIER